MAEYGQRNPDGSVTVYQDGVPVRTESWETNQGQPAAGGGGGNVGANPATFGPAISLADNAAMMAYNNARLALDRELGVMRNEREKERIALEAARDAWNKTYQTASMSGYMPNVAAGKGQAVMDAIGGLRSNAQYQTADGDVKRQMEAAAVAQATGIDPASAAQAIDRLRALTATTGQPSSAALVEQVLGQTPGGAPATLEREREQNRASMDALRLLSELRGPENAFAYANTLQNLPPQVRANIQAAMGRMPFTAQNPAQRGLFGDVGIGAAQPALPGGMPVGGQPVPGAYPGAGNTPVLQAGGRTLAGGGTVNQYLPAPVDTSPAGQMAQQAAQGAYRTATGAPAMGGQPGMVYAPESFPTTYGPRTAPAVAAGMQAASQWSPTVYNQTGDYARRLQLAAYENVGEDPREVMDQYKRSLPVAVGPRVGRYRGV